jgi:hypothetical protein
MPTDPTILRVKMKTFTVSTKLPQLNANKEHKLCVHPRSPGIHTLINHQGGRAVVSNYGCTLMALEIVGPGQGSGRVRGETS